MHKSSYVRRSEREEPERPPERTKKTKHLPQPLQAQPQPQATSPSSHPTNKLVPHHGSSNHGYHGSGHHGHSHHSQAQPSQKDSSPAKATPITVGELIISGYNGSLPQGDKGRRRSKFTLQRRPISNGVKPVKHHVVKNPQQSELIQDSKQHSVSFTLNRQQAIIVQYDPDSETDMFQIGRSSEGPIDFVVMDTVPGAQRAEDCVVTQSTISRFACRIIVERNPPYTARIYAAGFDQGRNIFLGEKATKWYSEGEIDGLTTNGVLIMNPVGGFSESSKPGVWREVSVNGGIYALRESRSTPQKSSLIEIEDNILRDGTLIDLCGATLLWRSAIGLLTSPSRTELEHQIEEINAGRPQCPVGLNTLVLPSKNTLTESEKQPYVYLECGHVHGQHGWGKGQDTNTRTCPMCRKNGAFVRLQTGQETSFYVDSNTPTHCFSPCGHMSSETTVKYWSSIPIPHGCHGFRAACPFCATPLQDDPGWVKLIFQDHVD
jgi:pellino protein